MLSAVKKQGVMGAAIEDLIQAGKAPEKVAAELRAEGQVGFTPGRREGWAS